MLAGMPSRLARISRRVQLLRDLNDARAKQDALAMLLAERALKASDARCGYARPPMAQYWLTGPMPTQERAA